VYRNAAWNATPTTTPIAYDTVDRDPAGLYSVANQRFTAPVAGWYLVVVRWAGSTTVGQGVDQAVLVNGVLYVSATSLVASATQWLKSSGTAVVRCAAGDYVQPAIGATTTVTMATGAVDSACTFSYLGTG
jgi:hypothetical protein